MIGFDTEPNTVESGQFSWQIVPREREFCSTTKDNCMATRCCKTSGYHCYEKNGTFAQCAKTCSPSASNLCRPVSEDLLPERKQFVPPRERRLAPRAQAICAAARAKTCSPSASNLCR